MANSTHKSTPDITQIPLVTSFRVPMIEKDFVKIKKFNLDTPIPVKPSMLLSNARLTGKQIKLGKEIALKHGLTK